jgi:hypothetical protein
MFVGLQVRGLSACIAPCLQRHRGHITVTLKTAGQWQSLEGTSHQADAGGVHTHLVSWSAPREHGPGQ